MRKKFIIEVKDYYQFTKSRIKGLRLELKIILLISILSILLIEFFLNKYPSKFQWQYDFGVIWLKLCYSYFSAFIFYYLVVYAPKERKRVKAFVLITNNIGRIIGLQRLILEFLYTELNPNTQNHPIDYSEEDIRDICKRINPKAPILISYFGKISFNNHYEFLNHFLNRMKTSISETIVLYDLLDDEILSNLALINNHIARLLDIDITRLGNKDLEFYSSSLNSLNIECNNMIKNKKNYDQRYLHQHKKHYIKKHNKQKI